LGAVLGFEVILNGIALLRENAIWNYTAKVWTITCYREHWTFLFFLGLDLTWLCWWRLTIHRTSNVESFETQFALCWIWPYGSMPCSVANCHRHWADESRTCSRSVCNWCSHISP
jgi:hypothetical protein